jgi:hypothetical protein
LGSDNEGIAKSSSPIPRPQRPDTDDKGEFAVNTMQKLLPPDTANHSGIVGAIGKFFF